MSLAEKGGASYNGVLSSSSKPTASSTVDAPPNNKGEPHHNEEHGDIRAATKLWLDSILNSYSFMWYLSIVLVAILSCYYTYPTTGDTQQQEYDPWTIWGRGFDFTKEREFWILDEDLPEDIATDLLSTNEEIRLEVTARRQLDPFH